MIKNAKCTSSREQHTSSSYFQMVREEYTEHAGGWEIMTVMTRVCVLTEWCKLPDEGVCVARQPATWKPRDKAPKHIASSNWPSGLPEVMESGLTEVQPPAASTHNFLVAGRPWFQTLRCCQTSPRDNSFQCRHHPPRFTVYSKSEAKRLGASIGQRAMY